MAKRQMWSTSEINELKKFINKGMSVEEIARALNRTPDSITSKTSKLEYQEGFTRVPESSMPKYNGALKSEGDAVILSDFEAPFHHADFINKVLDLADAWKVRTLHLAGDILHYDSLSKWGAEWTADNTEANIESLMMFIETLPQKYKKQAAEILESKPERQSELSSEMAEARRVFRSLNSFDNIYVAIGNHDDRYLRALDQATNAKELLHQIDRAHDERWHIAPYYYTLLDTPAGTFRIEHPRGAGRTAAQDLAVQYHKHILMGHSHRWAVNRDPSGKFWAVQMGHCVDEERLAYVMQRSAKRDAHCLGAVIVRDGHPWVLGEWSPFERMKKM